MHCDSDIPDCDELTDQDIINHVQGADDQEEETDAETDDEQAPTVTAGDAVMGLEAALSFFESQDDFDCVDAMLLRRLRLRAAAKRMANVRQRKISDFFM